MYFLNNVIYYTIIYVITNWVGCPAQTSAAKPLVEMSQKSINSNLFVLTGNIPETPEWGISNKYLPFIRLSVFALQHPDVFFCSSLS